MDQAIVHGLALLLLLLLPAPLMAAAPMKGHAPLVVSHSAPFVDVFRGARVTLQVTPTVESEAHCRWLIADRVLGRRRTLTLDTAEWSVGTHKILAIVYNQWGARSVVYQLVVRESAVVVDEDVAPPTLYPPPVHNGTRGALVRMRRGHAVVAHSESVTLIGLHPERLDGAFQLATPPDALATVNWQSDKLYHLMPGAWLEGDDKGVPRVARGTVRVVVRPAASAPAKSGRESLEPSANNGDGEPTHPTVTLSDLDQGAFMGTLLTLLAKFEIGTPIQRASVAQAEGPPAGAIIRVGRFDLIAKGAVDAVVSYAADGQRIEVLIVKGEAVIGASDKVNVSPLSVQAGQHVFAFGDGAFSLVTDTYADLPAPEPVYTSGDEPAAPPPPAEVRGMNVILTARAGAFRYHDAIALETNETHKGTVTSLLKLDTRLFVTTSIMMNVSYALVHSTEMQRFQYQAYGLGARYVFRRSDEKRTLFPYGGASLLVGHVNIRPGTIDDTMIATDVFGFEGELGLLYRLEKDWFVDFGFSQGNLGSIGPTSYAGQIQTYLIGMSWEK